MITFRNTFEIVVLILLSSLSAFHPVADESQPTGYDLAAEVNAYRAANGYYQLSPNSLVMAAAQTHAEWIVATGQGGHIGAGGSDETTRVSWTGYGGGAEIHCDENWASGQTISEVMYGAWSDWTHQEVMLNAWGNRYTDIGGGVAARGDGRYVFVLNVCMVVGQGSGGSVPDTGSDALATTDLSNYVYSVTRATPLADGTIKHTVLYGQTLTSIADAYGISIETLRELNNMAADDTVIWAEQELLIQAGTGTEEAQVSSTPGATATTQVLPTMTVPSGTVTPQPTPVNTRDGLSVKTLGIWLVGISAVGLAVVLYFAFVRK